MLGGNPAKFHAEKAPKTAAGTANDSKKCLLRVSTTRRRFLTLKGRFSGSQGASLPPRTGGKTVLFVRSGGRLARLCLASLDANRRGLRVRLRKSSGCFFSFTTPQSSHRESPAAALTGVAGVGTKDSTRAARLSLTVLRRNAMYTSSPDRPSTKRVSKPHGQQMLLGRGRNAQCTHRRAHPASQMPLRRGQTSCRWCAARAASEHTTRRLVVLVARASRATQCSSASCAHHGSRQQR